MNLIKLYRLNNFFYTYGVPLITKVFYVIQFLMYNSSVPASVKIGKGTKFAYLGIGCVIHARAVIGRNCTIGQGITIGGRSKKKDVPIIGNNCYLGAGCRILGDVKIGDNVIIGPNAVVLTDIPNNSIAVGIPAKVIKTNINPEDFI
jgi:serine O-acetyltransferase